MSFGKMSSNDLSRHQKNHLWSTSVAAAAAATMFELEHVSVFCFAFLCTYSEAQE